MYLSDDILVKVNNNKEPSYKGKVEFIIRLLSTEHNYL